MFVWSAIVAASLSWLFAHELVVAPVRGIQWCLIGLAWLLASRSDAPVMRLQLRRRHLVLLIPLLVAAGLAEAAVRPALGLLAAALVLGCTAADRSAALTRLARGGVAIGMLLLIQAPLFWVYSSWTAHNPDCPAAVPVVGALLGWLGCDVGVSGGVLYVQTIAKTHALPLTWNHLATYPVLLVAVGGAALLALRRGARIRNAVELVGVLVAYALLRFTLIFTVFLSRMLLVPVGSSQVHVELFWLPWITALSFLPLIPLLGILIRPPQGDDDPVARPARSAALVSVATVTAVLLVAAIQLPDPGVRKRGRVLFDESRSKWERTDTKLTPDWYGTESTYNYSEVFDYLGHHYDVAANQEHRLTPDLLAECDVLVLKTITDRYLPAEVDAIEAFVRGGGGLLALGEHTNVFGSGHYLNDVVRRFDLAFRYDCVFDVERKYEEMWFPPRYGRHPAAQHVPFFRFLVSASIQADTWDARPVIRGQGLWTLPIDYAISNFYPEPVDRTDARFGVFDQAMSRRVDEGRVLLFADSTVFSNFAAFFPGRPELLCGAVEWLNHENRWPHLERLLYAGAALGLLATLLLLIRQRPTALTTLAALASVAACALLTAAACDRAASAAYPLPQPDGELRSVTFEMDHGAYDLPIYGFTTAFRDSFEIFYAWALRAEVFPNAKLDWSQCFDSDALVIVRPQREFTGAEIGRLREYLEGGGSVLVMDSPANAGSAANQLLASFDFSLTDSPCHGATLLLPPTGVAVCDLQGGNEASPGRGSLAVTGGEPLLLSSKDEVVAAWRPVGRGQLVVAGLAEVFATPAMGGTQSHVPDDVMRSRYELAFALFRGLTGGGLARELEELSRRLGG